MSILSAISLLLFSLTSAWSNPFTFQPQPVRTVQSIQASAAPAGTQHGVFLQPAANPQLTAVDDLHYREGQLHVEP